MRLPSERAHSVHIVEMCAALSTINGGNVWLLAPTRATEVEEKDVYKYYGVPKNFEIIRCKSFDAFRLPIPRKLAYYIHAFTFARSVLKAVRDYPDAIILSRDLYSAYELVRQGRKVAFEVHDFPGAIGIKTKWIFRENMVFAIEPAIYTKNFGIRIEDDVVVSKKGVKRLSSAPKKLTEL